MVDALLTLIGMSSRVNGGMLRGEGGKRSALLEFAHHSLSFIRVRIFSSHI